MSAESRVVLDTTVVIDVLRNRPGAVAYVAGLAQPGVCSEATRTEVIRGMRSAERSATEALLGVLEWVPIDERISRRAGELGRRFRASHGLLDVADLLIAATAEVHDLPLATRNVKHFPMFPGLRPPYGEPLG